MIDKKLLEIVRDPQNPIALTLIVNGAVVSGMLISEQEFFIESLRTSKAGYGGRSEKMFNNIEDLSLKVSRSVTDEPAYIHLTNVFVHVSTEELGKIPLPALRISPEHVSAWMFGLPAYSTDAADGALRRRLAEQESRGRHAQP